MAEQYDLAFYQHLFNESLFLVLEQPAAAAPLPASLPMNIQPVSPPISGDTKPTKKFRVVGKNQKGLSLLFSLPEADFNVLPQNEFLTKILAAIQHAPDDVVYVNIQPNYALNIFDLKKEITVQHVVAFGKNLIDLAPGFNLNLYTPAVISDLPFLQAEPLATIENDVNRKKSLWNGLQVIFKK